MAEIEIKHLKEILDYLKEGEKNPIARKEAQRFVSEWDLFENAHPEVGLFHSDTEWYDWANDPEHAGLVENKDLWMGREIRDAYEIFETYGEPHEEHGSDDHNPQQHEENASILDNTFRIAAGATLTAFATPQYMEDDKKYKSIRKKAIQDWEKANGKKINSLEGQEFLYGSLDGKTPSTLDAFTEAKYREYANEGNGKYKHRLKALKRYEETRAEVGQNAEFDPIIQRETEKTKKIIKARQKALEKAGQKISIEELTSIQNRYMWDRFAETCPAKAEGYKDHLPAKLAFERKRLASLKRSAEVQPQLSKNQKRIQELRDSVTARSAQNDPEVQRIDHAISQQARSVVAGHRSGDVKAYQAIRAELGDKAWDEYVSKNPKLAKFYTASHHGIRGAVERKLAKERMDARNIELANQAQKKQRSLSARAIKQLNRFFSRMPTRQFPSYSLQRPSMPNVSNIRNAAQSIQRIGQLGRLGSMGSAAGAAGGAAAGAGAAGAGTAAAGAGGAAAGAAASGGAAAAAPFIAIGVGIFILVLIVLLIVLKMFEGTGEKMGSNQPGDGIIASTIPGLTLTLSAPSQVENKNLITYTITAKYSGSDEIVVYDPFPSQLEVRESTGDPVVEGNTLTWILSKKQPQSSDETGKTYIFTVTVFPTIDDTEVRNAVFAKNLSSTNTIVNNSIPTNEDSCGGIYSNEFAKLLSRLGIRKNFGDPGCDMKKDPNKIATYLQQVDPENARKWMLIIECESTYSPNEFNPQSTDGTAWGLLQMHPEGKGNTKNDRGDVFWQQQITNAVAYNKEINNSFKYWSCAQKHGFWR